VPLADGEIAQLAEVTPAAIADGGGALGRVKETGRLAFHGRLPGAAGALLPVDGRKGLHEEGGAAAGARLLDKTLEGAGKSGRGEGEPAERTLDLANGRRRESHAEVIAFAGRSGFT
jgi:hypothetical protein